VSDRLDKLEAELAAMRPRDLPPRVVDGVERALIASPQRTRPWSDRLLIASMAAGSLAACVIVGVVLIALANASTAPPRAPAPVMATVPHAGDVMLALARANLNDTQ
jgi:hypothetical protein